MSLMLRHSPVHPLCEQSKESPIERMLGSSDHQQILLAHCIARQLGQFGRWTPDGGVGEREGSFGSFDFEFERACLGFGR